MVGFPNDPVPPGGDAPHQTARPTTQPAPNAGAQRLAATGSIGAAHQTNAATGNNGRPHNRE